MKLTGLHVLNGVLWVANAALWAFYSHVPFMAAVSSLAAAGAFYMARIEHNS